LRILIVSDFTFQILNDGVLFFEGGVLFQQISPFYHICDTALKEKDAVIQNLKRKIAENEYSQKGRKSK